ncbi:MAG: adhesin, partial [Sulfurimonas sp.]|nr:adhesin [Sulfurimonas sp.]
QVTDKENSDTAMLNRDITDNKVDIYDIQSHKGLSVELDTRLLSKKGQDEIKQEYEAMNKNMNIIAGTLPDATSDNVIEATAGEVWNTLTKYLSLGLVPSNENRGGILAEIPILTGTKDSAHKVLQVVNKLSTKFNEDDYIRMEDSSYYKTLSAEDKKEFDGKGLYVSKAPIEITQESATYQNSINGMMNSEAEAIKNGLLQTGQMNTDKAVELTVGYNPSYGFLPDLLESAVDKSGIGTTGIAKQTGEYVNNVTASRGNTGSNFAMHSQANVIVYNGIQYVQENGGGFKPVEYYKIDGKIEPNVPTFVSFGSPMNKDDMNKLITDPQDKGGVGYGYSGAFTKQDDFVGESLGANSGNNAQATIFEQANILNAYKLFTSDSPHGTYVCQDYAGFGVKCGYRE